MTTAPDINNSVHTRLVLDPEQVRRITQGESGPVVRDLMRRAELLVQLARAQIRVGHVAAGTGPHGVNLRDTLVKRIVRGTDGNIEIIVGSEHPIAYIHHEGTRPHTILPRDRLRGVLVFPSERGGVIFARRVHHPGTHPNRYLSDNLKIIARR